MLLLIQVQSQSNELNEGNLEEDEDFTEMVTQVIQKQVETQDFYEEVCFQFFMQWGKERKMKIYSAKESDEEEGSSDTQNDVYVTYTDTLQEVPEMELIGQCSEQLSSEEQEHPLQRRVRREPQLRLKQF